MISVAGISQHLPLKSRQASLLIHVVRKIPISHIMVAMLPVTMLPLVSRRCQRIRCFRARWPKMKDGQPLIPSIKVGNSSEV